LTNERSSFIIKGMRSIRRTGFRMPPLPRGLARDIGLVCLADTLVGLSFGAIATAAGFPIWVPALMSVVVFAGASQFLFIAIVGSGGNPIAAVAAGLLVNARHLPFGLAVGDALGTGRLRRTVGSHLLIDESAAFALSQQDPRRRSAAFWACGIGLFCCWNAGVVVGALIGSVVTDTGALGMDAAFPAVLLALLAPALRDRWTGIGAVVGAVVALGFAVILPAGLPVLLALLSLPLALRGSASSASGTTTATPTGNRRPV